MNTIIVSSSLSINSNSFIVCSLIQDILKRENIHCELIDARKLKLLPYHRYVENDIKLLKNKLDHCDNIIFWMGVHNYSINDSLKIILDTCLNNVEGKLYGIVCAAGGEKSYLSTMHLTQICMNEWRMIQLPRIIYATKKDFNKNIVSSQDLKSRINVFCKEFITIGKKLLS